jgi:hypothetical protein
VLHQMLTEPCCMYATLLCEAEAEATGGWNEARRAEAERGRSTRGTDGAVRITCRPTLPCEPTSSTLGYIGSSGQFEGRGVSTSRESPPAPLSISYGRVGSLKARAFPPPV